MNYTLHQLRVFSRVVETRSITKASHLLHMTQPAVSIQLRNLQDQFDIPLTETIGKRIYITEFGLELYESAQNVLLEVEMLNDKSKHFKGLLAGRLRITAVSTGKYLAPYFINGFLEAHPEIDLNLDIGNHLQVFRAMKKNEADLAFVSHNIKGLELEEEFLMENFNFLVGSEPERDPRKALIFREKGSAMREMMEKIFSKQHKTIELTSNEAIKQAVMAGMGYSVIPLIGIKNELLSGELHILKEPYFPLVTQWRLIWLREKKLSPVTRAFIEYLRQHKREIIASHFNWYDRIGERKPFQGS